MRHRALNEFRIFFFILNVMDNNLLCPSASLLAFKTNAPVQRRRVVPSAATGSWAVDDHTTQVGERSPGTPDWIAETNSASSAKCCRRVSANGALRARSRQKASRAASTRAESRLSGS